jgi:hypothetical protein
MQGITITCVSLIDALVFAVVLEPERSGRQMIHAFWRLNEAGPDNLGLACTDDGLLLGRTLLIVRRRGRFVVRERSEIER